MNKCSGSFFFPIIEILIPEHKVLRTLETISPIYIYMCYQMTNPKRKTVHMRTR